MKRAFSIVLVLCIIFSFCSCDKPNYQQEQYVQKSDADVLNENYPSVQRIIIPTSGNDFYFNNTTCAGNSVYTEDGKIYAKADMFDGKMDIVLSENALMLTLNGSKIASNENGYVDVENLCRTFNFDYMYNSVKNTAIITKRNYTPIVFDENLIANAKATVLEKTKKIDEHCGSGFPEGSLYGVYEPNASPGWVGGFYTGLNYLCQNWSDDGIYKETAQNTQTILENMIKANDQVFLHDIGFVSYLSSYKQYMQTKDENAKNMTLTAADALLKRVKPNGGYIQAWGSLDATEKKSENDTRMIADTMCNLPLLFAASEISADNKYKDAAIRHAKLTQQFIMRKDATVTHTFVFNEDGTNGTERTHQGANDASCWARGTAWVILGMSQAYEATGDASFLNSAKELADTYVLKTDGDLIPRWDFIYQSDTTEPKDSSAAAIAACGFYNLYEITGDEYYKSLAYSVFESLYNNYSSKNDENSSGIIYHATGHKPNNKNIDVCLIYGDYYFAELLARFSNENIGY